MNNSNTLRSASLLRAAAKGRGHPPTPAAEPAPERVPLDPSAPEGFVGLFVRCHPSDLRTAVAAVQPLTGRIGIPALRGVLMRAEKVLSITATDLETSQTRTVPEAVVCSGGVALVPAKPLAASLAALEPDEEIAVWVEDEILCIGQGARTFRLRSLPPEEYPVLPEPGDVVSSTTGPTLARALARIAGCASTDEARPVLTGVLLDLEKGSTEAELVATDSFRLGIVRLALIEPARHPARALIPAGVARQLARAVAGAPVVVLRIRGTEGFAVQMVMDGGAAVEWTVRQIEGEFPNWRALVPEGDQGRERIEADTAELRAAIRRAAVFADEADRIPIVLTANGTVWVDAAHPELGQYEEVLETGTFDGEEERQVSYNPGYLDDGLAFADVERVALSIPVDKPLSATVIAGDGATYLLMPVRFPPTAAKGGQ